MKIIKAGKSVAIAIAILGVIHNVATFSPIIKGALSCLPLNDFNSVLYMSLMCGSALIISGLVLYILLNKLLNYPFLITPIMILGIFLAFNGICIIVFMGNLFANPFALIGVLLNLFMFLITATLAISLKRKPKAKRWFNYL